jgi:hypothetical protein
VTWWVWALVILIGIPAGCLMLSLLALIVMAAIPERFWPPQCCGCCGKWGHHRRRNSQGYYICDACAGPGELGDPNVRHDHQHFFNP